MPTPQPSQPAASPGQLAAVRELNLRYFDPDFSDEQRSVVDELNRRTGHPSRSPGDVISRIAARRTAAPQDFGPPQSSAGAGEMTGAGLRGVPKGLLGLIPGVTGKPSGPPTGTPSDTLLRSDPNAAAYGVTDDPFTWAASAIGGVMDRTAALERNQPDTPAQAVVRSAGTLVPQIEDVAAPGMAYGEENRAPTREENLRAAEGGGSLAAVAALPIALKRLPAALRKVSSPSTAPAEAAAVAPRADAINRVIGDGSYINRRSIDVGRAFADAGVEIDPREIRRNPRALVDYTDRVIDRENLAADQLLQSEAAQAPAANGHVVARGPRTIALLNSADIEAARAVDDYVTRRVDELSARHGGNGAISVADADLLKRELQNRANYDKIFGNTALTTSDNLRNQLLADTAQRFDRLGDTIPGYRELNNRRSSLIHWRDNLLDPIVDTAKTGGKRPSRVVAGARTAAAAVRGDVHGIVRGASDLAAAQGKLPTPERVARAIRSAVQGREASGPTAEILRTAAPRAQPAPPQPPPSNPDFAAGESGPAYTTGGRVGQTAAAFSPTGPTELATQLGPPADRAGQQITAQAAATAAKIAQQRTAMGQDATAAAGRMAERPALNPAASPEYAPPDTFVRLPAKRGLLGPPSGPSVQPTTGLQFEADTPLSPAFWRGRRRITVKGTQPSGAATLPPSPSSLLDDGLPHEVLAGEQPVTFDHPTDGKIAGTVARHFVRADGKRALIVQTPKGERMATADMVRLPKVRAVSGAAAAPALSSSSAVPPSVPGGSPESPPAAGDARKQHELKQANPGMSDGATTIGHDTFGDMLFGSSANAEERVPSGAKPPQSVPPAVPLPEMSSTTANGGQVVGRKPAPATGAAPITRAQQELERNGITSEQKAAYRPKISETLYRAFDATEEYDDPSTIAAEIEKAKRRLKGENVGDERDPGVNDAWRMYLGMPQQHKTFSISPYTPSIKKDGAEPYYYRINNFWPKFFSAEQAPPAEQVKSIVSDIDESDGGRLHLDNDMIMREYEVMRSQDAKGPYIAVYDRWDLSPVVKRSGNNQVMQMEKVIGRPFEIYDRLYYDPKTFEPKFNDAPRR